MIAVAEANNLGCAAKNRAHLLDLNALSYIVILVDADGVNP